MQCQPVSRQDAEARAKIQREPVVTRELHAADSHQRVKTTVHGGLATKEDLARKEVVAQREAVIRELPLISAKQLDVAAQRLETGASGRGPAQIPAKEE